ncbi:hypothetical protein GRI58_03630 [Porphyrobacter algicida]|uniref:DNA primase/polymerase bifunctional N-terminal domain-containing protein n=1 Tax=Qipengyuania algicida TaxID=1836209 RepID=A0A845ABT7_9SPHN|nr:bifunctional DNA primase/polymerase [Qipengyuania algicida]MXP27912.1 hypothetical protein [Qipengyuania algicida]
MLDEALGYAAKGLPVFPCNPATKRPRVEGGLHSATTDAEQIKAWWGRWPNAMIGMPTGKRTGFWALDVDDPAAFEAGCGLELPGTRRCNTGKGYHLLFKYDPYREVRNQQRGAKDGPWPMPELPGAEVRGEGGYVIVPPSLHPNGKRYRWHDDATVTDPPSALLSIVRGKRKQREAGYPANDLPSFRERDGSDRSYGLSALKSECEAIRNAGDGEQEGTLNAAALKIGALVAGGEISPVTAREKLMEAAMNMASFDPRNPWTGEILSRKVDRGLADGAASPRSARKRGVGLDDFRAYMPQHSYIFAPTGELWPASSVNSRIPPVKVTGADGEPLPDKKGDAREIKASAWLDENHPVEQMTWIPGKAQVVADKLVSDGGWRDRPGCNVFNLYRPPVERIGDAGLAGPWIEHLRRVYPEDADHLIRWFAQRVQRPWEKINHALVLGGSQGIGKDTILEPVKEAIGPWNFAEVSPQHMLGRFNGFVKSVILRVSEARDLGEVDRFAFYDHMKTYTAAPPDVLRVDEKHLREYSVFNVCGVIITSNHKTDGIYLPTDDRRHYVAWSTLSRESFEADYWQRLYGWFANGGTGHVAAYLREFDLTDFDPKSPPPQTTAFWDIVSANQAPEDAELADALEMLSWPNAVTVASIASVSPPGFADWLTDRRNSRRIPHRLEQCGYVPVRNDTANDGLFKIGGKRCVVYARHNLGLRDQIASVEALIRR